MYFYQQHGSAETRIRQLPHQRVGTRQTTKREGKEGEGEKRPQRSAYARHGRVAVSRGKKNISPTRLLSFKLAQRLQSVDVIIAAGYAVTLAGISAPAISGRTKMVHGTCVC
ncbi:hypothetical protein LSM04_000245 [Trypanosoma melophagium]|uniref:uncharacterized protein n=1 Tax=Trypanosoma melophagium TaxID=715481 RepID=UPI00351A4250|nr:hypothetical protein LSM04_000245 [Trypanosoma melophagium]